VIRRHLFAGLAAVLVMLGCTDLEPFRIDTYDLPNGRVGEAYDARIETSGGHGNVSLRFLDGQLPPGIGFRQQDEAGQLYGVPSRDGDYQFTIEARDSSGAEAPSPDGIVTFGYAVTVDP
jgi:hypothetical protein